MSTHPLILLTLALLAAGCTPSTDRSYSYTAEGDGFDLSQSGSPIEPPVEVSTEFTDVFHVYSGPDGAVAVQLDSGPLMVGTRAGGVVEATTYTTREYRYSTCTVSHDFEMRIYMEIAAGVAVGDLELRLIQAGVCDGQSVDVDASMTFDVEGVRLTKKGEYLPTSGPRTNPWPVEF